MASDYNNVAEQAYNGMVTWYASATAGKPKGYKLTPKQESERQSWVLTAKAAADTANVEALSGSADEKQALWWLLQVAKFDAVTTGSAKQAVAAATQARTLATQLLSYGAGGADADQLRLDVDRANLIIAANGSKSAASWADTLGCNVADFWSPCGAAEQSNWLIWVLGAAVVVWYGRKKKWF